MEYEPLTGKQGEELIKILAKKLQNDYYSKINDLIDKHTAQAEKLTVMYVEQKMELRRIMRYRTGVFKILNKKKERDLKDNIFSIEEKREKLLLSIKKLHEKNVPSTRTVDYLKEQLKDSKAFKEVDKVHLVKNGILVETKDITCGGKNIGVYLIYIDLYNEKVKVHRKDGKWFAPTVPLGPINLFLPEDEKIRVEHPHVVSGVVCFGNIKNTVNESLKAGKFYDILLAVISILETYNQKDAYTDLKNFIKKINSTDKPKRRNKHGKKDI